MKKEGFKALIILAAFALGGVILQQVVGALLRLIYGPEEAVGTLAGVLYLFQPLVAVILTLIGMLVALWIASASADAGQKGKSTSSPFPLVAALLLLLILAKLSGAGWFAVLLVLAGIVLSFVLAVYPACGGVQWLKASWDNLLLVLTIERCKETIEDGQPRVKGPSRDLGPRELVIKPYNAVTLEEGTQQTKILGPLKLKDVKPTETVKHIYDLRPKRDHFEYREVLTHELIPTTVTGLMLYRIDVGLDTACGKLAPGQTPSGLLPQDEQVIQAIEVLGPTEWPTATQHAVEESVRAAIGRHNLEDLLVRDLPRSLNEEICARATAATKKWGVAVDGAVVRSIRPEREVTQAAAGVWMASQQGQAAAAVDEARVQALATALSSLNDAYIRAQQTGMPLSAIEWESFRRTLEWIFKEIRINIK